MNHCANETTDRSVAGQIKNGELAEITLTDGTTIHADTVWVQANGWIKVKSTGPGTPSHYPPHTVDEIHGRSGGKHDAVRYQSPHGESK